MKLVLIIFLLCNIYLQKSATENLGNDIFKLDEIGNPEKLNLLLKNEIRKDLDGQVSLFDKEKKDLKIKLSGESEENNKNPKKVNGYLNCYFLKFFELKYKKSAEIFLYIKKELIKMYDCKKGFTNKINLEVLDFIIKRDHFEKIISSDAKVCESNDISFEKSLWKISFKYLIKKYDFIENFNIFFSDYLMYIYNFKNLENNLFTQKFDFSYRIFLSLSIGQSYIYKYLIKYTEIDITILTEMINGIFSTLKKLYLEYDSNNNITTKRLIIVKLIEFYKIYFSNIQNSKKKINFNKFFLIKTKLFLFKYPEILKEIQLFFINSEEIIIEKNQEKILKINKKKELDETEIRDFNNWFKIEIENILKEMFYYKKIINKNQDQYTYSLFVNLQLEDFRIFKKLKNKYVSLLILKEKKLLEDFEKNVNLKKDQNKINEEYKLLLTNFIKEEKITISSEKFNLFKKILNQYVSFKNYFNLSLESIVIDTDENTHSIELYNILNSKNEDLKKFLLEFLLIEKIDNKKTFNKIKYIFNTTISHIKYLDHFNSSKIFIKNFLIIFSSLIVTNTLEHDKNNNKIGFFKDLLEINTNLSLIKKYYDENILEIIKFLQDLFISFNNIKLEKSFYDNFLVYLFKLEFGDDFINIILKNLGNLCELKKKNDFDFKNIIINILKDNFKNKNSLYNEILSNYFLNFKSVRNLLDHCNEKTFEEDILDDDFEVEEEDDDEDDSYEINQVKINEKIRLIKIESNKKFT